MQLINIYVLRELTGELISVWRVDLEKSLWLCLGLLLGVLLLVRTTKNEKLLHFAPLLTDLNPRSGTLVEKQEDGCFPKPGFSFHSCLPKLLASPELLFLELR